MPDGSFIDFNDAKPQLPENYTNLQRRDRYVRTDDARRMVQGREAEIVRALGVPWDGRSDHIHCPYRNHEDRHPSWRLMDDGHAVCTCRHGRPHSVFDVIMEMEGSDFDAAKMRAAEIVGALAARAKPNGKANGHDRKLQSVDQKTAREVAYIKQHCLPAYGTLVETYLRSRGLELPADCADIQFHPDLTDYGGKIGRPAMIAVIRDPVTGQETGGIWRTYLQDDGCGKAADMRSAKMGLGPVAGGAVMLMPMGADGTLGVAEGQETALAAAMIFGVPVWAGLFAGNMRKLAFPRGLKKLFIFADRGEVGQSAAEDLGRRAIDAGIETEIYLPHGLKDGADFNDDLLGGDCRAEDYTPCRTAGGQSTEQPWTVAPVEPVSSVSDTDSQCTGSEAEIIPPPRTEAELIAAARSIDRSDTPELEQILRGCVDLDPLAQQRVLEAVKKQTSFALGTLKEQVKRYRNELAKAKECAADDEVKRLKIGSDVEIAECVAVDLNGEFGEIIHADGDFWRYSGSHWEAIDEPHARQAVHKYDGAVYYKPSGAAVVQLSKAHVDSVLHEMSAKLARPEFFAEAPAGINCATGFIAFDRDGKPNLLPHDPEHRCRHALPGRWRPGVTNPENPPPHSLLGRLLDGVFKGDADAVEKRKLLAEVAGAAAVGYGPKLRQPKAVVLAGETAENGKSQILDVIRGLLPSSAVASVSASKFGDERFIVGLRGKLLNATDELSEGAIASEAFKAAITGNPVSGRDVYRSAITFRPVAQHIFAVNRLPKFSGGMDRGVQRRLLPITFNRVIPSNERVEDIGQRVGQEESDLLLAFAVAGAERLIRQRGFTMPESSKTALQQWIYRDNPVIAWVKARCNPAPLPVPGQKMLAIKSSYAHSLFRDWAIAAGFDPRTLPDVNGFVQRLKENQIVKGIDVKHTRTGNWLVGLEILTKDHSPDEDGITEMNPLGGYDLNQIRR